MKRIILLLALCAACATSNKQVSKRSTIVSKEPNSQIKKIKQPITYDWTYICEGKPSKSAKYVIKEDGEQFGACEKTQIKASNGETFTFRNIHTNGFGSQTFYQVKKLTNNYAFVSSSGTETQDFILFVFKNKKFYDVSESISESADKKYLSFVDEPQEIVGFIPRKMIIFENKESDLVPTLLVVFNNDNFMCPATAQCFRNQDHEIYFNDNIWKGSSELSGFLCEASTSHCKLQASIRVQNKKWAPSWKVSDYKLNESEKKYDLGFQPQLEENRSAEEKKWDKNCENGKIEDCYKFGLKLYQSNEKTIGSQYLKDACDKNFAKACFEFSKLFDQGSAWRVKYVEMACAAGEWVACLENGVTSILLRNVNLYHEKFNKACLNDDLKLCDEAKTLELSLDAFFKQNSLFENYFQLAPLARLLADLKLNLGKREEAIALYRTDCQFHLKINSCDRLEQINAGPADDFHINVAGISSTLYLPKHLDFYLKKVIPTFRQYTPENFPENIVKSYQFTRNQMMSVVIGDFNGDGEFDLVMHGTDAEGDVSYKIISTKNRYELSLFSVRQGDALSIHEKTFIQPNKLNYFTYNKAGHSCPHDGLTEQSEADGKKSFAFCWKDNDLKGQAVSN